MIRNRKTFATLIVLITLALFSTLSGWIVFRGVNTLSRHGRRIGRLGGEIPLQGPQKPEWLSDHEALYLSYFPVGDRFEFTKVNADTGDKSPMVDLNTRFAQQLRSVTVKMGRTPTAHLPPDIVLSPSRNRIVIAEAGMTAPTKACPAIYHVTDVNAATDLKWLVTSNVGPPPIWLKDSTRCVQPVYLNGESAQVFSIDLPNQSRDSGFHSNPPPSRFLIAAIPQDRIWEFDGAMGAVDISEWDPFSGAVSHKTHLFLPVRGYVSGAAISPRGDRVAWLIPYNHDDPLSRWLMRRRPRSPFNQFARISIWTSNLDGSQMHEVGSDDISRFKYNDNYIKWLPGGKKLAFHLGSDLYTIPVE